MGTISVPGYKHDQLQRLLAHVIIWHAYKFTLRTSWRRSDWSRARISFLARVTVGSPPTTTQGEFVGGPDNNVDEQSLQLPMDITNITTNTFLTLIKPLMIINLVNLEH